MKTRKIILSYDYELFFGDRSGTVLKSIIEPTNKLMDLMEKNGFRGSFFVDYLMFRELEKQTEEQAVADLMMLKEQIRDMVRRGHRVELHLHPHWIDAKYNGDGTWDFTDFTHYSLSSLDEDSIVDLFVSGTNYITSLAREVDSSYKVVAFRAGGWAVQPFEKLRRGFVESGIRIDSSTSFGMHCAKKGQLFDFRAMPLKMSYRFEDDVCEEVGNGRFIEIPITSYKQNMVIKLIWRLSSFNTERVTDGSHNRKSSVDDGSSHSESIWSKLFSPPRNMLSFSQFPPLVCYVALLFRKERIVCAIDHPKDFSLCTGKGIEMMAKLYSNYSFIDYIDDTEGNLL